ncbi:acyl transferase/acyl hydrolase/lysophospholipase [Xylariales sp. PMI_506]|nr:acyl transferase/acyl hydrolase/lysophospholipase [Xylariales sp. PMI_506]
MATMQGGLPNPIDTDGLCLLSLDGGGVRGLSSLYILKSIMDRLNQVRKDDKLEPVKPCHVFDLIGGTSTGGLISIMLGRLEMDVDECIEAYGDLAKTVFGKKKSLGPFDFRGKIKSRFDSAKLSAAIRKVIKDRSMSEDDLFNDGAERSCKTFVCTVDRHTKDIIHLRSYHLPDEPNIPATICQAAMATSAATTFFEPVNIGDRSFADGALGANNPVDEVEGEASNIWCSETGDLKPLVKCFVSIGTGNPGRKAFEDSMAGFLTETLVKIATETENSEKRFVGRWAEHFDQKRYFRFNVEQGLQQIGLYEYEKKGAMEAATEGYLTHMDQKFRVRDCIQNLKLKQNGLEKSLSGALKEFTNRPIQQIGPKLCRPVWIVPFEKNPRFTGREPQLAELEEMLFFTDHTIKVAVTGLGGVGKTQLVLELLFRTQKKYPGCSIIWIPATNMESLHQAYLDAAQKLDIPGWQQAKDVIQLVQQYLSSESAGQWLLVYDNADDVDMWTTKAGHEPQPHQQSRPLIDYLPNKKQGAIVFTTRNRKAAVDLARDVILVPDVDKDMASQLLVNQLNDKALSKDQDTAASLLEELAYLPLAIVQAAAYINKNGIDLSEYLQLMREQELELIDLLSEEFKDDWRYRDIKNPVATTWLISFEQIASHDRLAADYLSLMACVEAKDIPQSLLPPGPSRKKEKDAIGTLTAYSFIIKRSIDDRFDIHRLVHLATRNWLRNKDLLTQWTILALLRIDEVFPKDNDHINRNLWRKYLTHAHHVLLSNHIDQSWKVRIDLLYRYGKCLQADGRWNDAESSFSQVLELRQRSLGLGHPLTTMCMAWLASTYRNRGRWEEVEQLDIQVLETAKAKLGVDHPDTLTSMNNLALTYWNQRRWSEAEQLQVQVLETRKTKLGVDHPDTLTTMDNLSLTYWDQGRWDEAEQLQVQVLETRKTKLGVEHPDTLTTMDNHTLAYWDQGRFEEAEQLQVHVLPEPPPCQNEYEYEASATFSISMSSEDGNRLAVLGIYPPR